MATLEVNISTVQANSAITSLTGKFYDLDNKAKEAGKSISSAFSGKNSSFDFFAKELKKIENEANAAYKSLLQLTKSDLHPIGNSAQVAATKLEILKKTVDAVVTSQARLDIQKDKSAQKIIRENLYIDKEIAALKKLQAINGSMWTGSDKKVSFQEQLAEHEKLIKVLKKEKKVRNDLKQGNYQAAINKEQASIKALNIQREKAIASNVKALALQRKLNLETQKRSIELKNMAKAILWEQKYAKALNRSEKEAKEARLAEERLRKERTKGSSEQNTNSFGKGIAAGLGNSWMAYAGNMAAIAAGFVTARIAATSFQDALDFEYVTKYSQAISDTSVSIDTIRNSLLSIDGVASSPTELAAGFRELVKAGEDVDSILSGDGVLKSMSHFSTIAEQDLATSIQLVVTQVNAFADVTKKSTGITLDYAAAADMMVAAVFDAPIGFNDLAQSLKHTTELATTVGASFDEVVTALSLMGEAGIKGSLAGTALRTSLIKLVNPSDKLAAKFKLLGVNIADAFDKDGTMNVKKSLLLYRDMYKELDTISKVSFIKDTFGLRSQKAIAAMMKELDNWDEKSQKIADSSGKIDDAYSEVSDTLRIAGLEFKAAFSGEVIEQFLPIIRQIVPVIQDMTKNIDGVVDSLFLAAKAAGAFIAALALSKSITVVTTMATAYKSMAVSIGLANTSMNALLATTRLFAPLAALIASYKISEAVFSPYIGKANKFEGLTKEESSKKFLTDDYKKYAKLVKDEKALISTTGEDSSFGKAAIENLAEYNIDLDRTLATMNAMKIVYGTVFSKEIEGVLADRNKTQDPLGSWLNKTLEERKAQVSETDKAFIGPGLNIKSQEKYAKIAEDIRTEANKALENAQELLAQAEYDSSVAHLDSFDKKIAKVDFDIQKSREKGASEDLLAFTEKAAKEAIIKNNIEKENLEAKKSMALQDKEISIELDKQTAELNKQKNVLWELENLAPKTSEMSKKETIRVDADNNNKKYNRSINNNDLIADKQKLNLIAEHTKLIEKQTQAKLAGVSAQEKAKVDKSVIKYSLETEKIGLKTPEQYNLGEQEKIMNSSINLMNEYRLDAEKTGATESEINRIYDERLEKLRATTQAKLNDAAASEVEKNALLAEDAANYTDKYYKGGKAKEFQGISTLDNRATYEMSKFENQSFYTDLKKSDPTAATKAYNDQLKVVKELVYSQENYQKILEANIELIKEDGESVWDGFNAGSLEAMLNMKSLGQLGFDMFGIVKEGLSSSLSTIGKDLLYGISDAKDVINDAYSVDLDELKSNYNEAVLEADNNAEQLTDLAEQYNKDKLEITEQYNDDIRDAENKLSDDLKEIWDNTWKGLADSAIDFVSEQITNKALNIGVDFVNDLFPGLGLDSFGGARVINGAMLVQVVNGSETGSSLEGAGDSVSLAEKAWDWWNGDGSSDMWGDVSSTTGQYTDFKGLYDNFDSSVDTSGWDISGLSSDLSSSVWESADIASAGTTFWSASGDALTGTNMGRTLDSLDDSFSSMEKTLADSKAWEASFDWNKTDYTIAEKLKGYWEISKPYVSAATGAYSIYSGVNRIGDDPVGGSLQAAGGVNQLYNAGVDMGAYSKDAIPLMDSVGNVIGFAGGAYGTYTNLKDGNYIGAASSAYGTVTSGAALAASATGATEGSTLAAVGAGSSYALPVAVGAMVAAGIADHFSGKGYSDKTFTSDNYGSFSTHEYDDTQRQGTILLDAGEDIAMNASFASLFGSNDNARNDALNMAGADAFSPQTESMLEASFFTDMGDAALTGMRDNAKAHWEVLARDFDDEFAKMALSLDDTAIDFERFEESVTGLDVSAADAARHLELATEVAATGSAAALQELNQELGKYTSSAEEASVVGSALVSSIDDETIAKANLQDANEDTIDVFDELAKSVEGGAEATQLQLDMLNTQEQQLRELSAAGQDLTQPLKDLEEQLIRSGYSAKDAAKYVANYAKELSQEAVSHMAVASSEEVYHAKGGFVGYASGGVLEGGSGVRDDLYLGTVNGRKQIAMGGEYIMPPTQTKKYSRELEMMRADTYASGGFLGWMPILSPSEKMDAMNPYAGMRSTNGELSNIRKVIADMNDVLGAANLDEYADSVRKINIEYDAIANEMRSFGASEADIHKVRNAQSEEISAAYAKAYEEEQARMTSLSDLLYPLKDMHDGLNSFDVSMNNTTKTYENLISQAEELGASESQLNYIRETSALAIAELIEENKKAISDLVTPYNDLNTSMSDMAIWVRDLGLEYDDAIDAAIELGASEETLTAIRNAQAVEIQNAINDTLDGAFDIIDKDTLSDLEYTVKGINDSWDSVVQDLRDLGLDDTSAEIKTANQARDIELSNASGMDTLDYYTDIAEKGAVVSTFGSNSGVNNLNTQNNIEVKVVVDGSGIINETELATKIVEVSDGNVYSKDRRDYSGQTVRPSVI